MKTALVNEIEILYRPNYDKANLTKVTRLDEVVNFLRSIWTEDIEHRERFYALYLNRQNKILGYYLVSIGGIASTYVDVKLVFQAAFSLNASGIIVAHNHPSGNITPSASDTNLTERISNVGKLLDMPLIDHIILTTNSSYSYAENTSILNKH